MDADIYPVWQPAGKRRARCKPTSEIQKKLNQRNAARKLTRLVHSNFTDKDIALHLTYDEAPDTSEEAARDLSNFLRRVKRARAKAGLSELKYISTTEIGMKSGRIHHHIILSGGLDRDALEVLWGKGYANSKRLQFREDGVSGLTHYIVKDDRPFYKRWNQSKNLIKPEPTVRDGAVTRDEVREMQDAIDGKCAAYFEARYPGYELTRADYSINGINRGEYVTISMRRKRGGG
jgi:hypothetical protein